MSQWKQITSCESKPYIDALASYLQSKVNPPQSLRVEKREDCWCIDGDTSQGVNSLAWDIATDFEAGWIAAWKAVWDAIDHKG